MFNQQIHTNTSLFHIKTEKQTRYIVVEVIVRRLRIQTCGVDAKKLWKSTMVDAGKY